MCWKSKKLYSCDSFLRRSSSDSPGWHVGAHFPSKGIKHQSLQMLISRYVWRPTPLPLHIINYVLKFYFPWRINEVIGETGLSWPGAGRTKMKEPFSLGKWLKNNVDSKGNYRCSRHSRCVTAIPDCHSLGFVSSGVITTPCPPGMVSLHPGTLEPGIQYPLWL